jgi:hypothetical protein
MNSLPVHQENSVEGSFSAQGYFLGIAQGILESFQDAHVVLPGKGEAYLFPRRNEYYASIPDMADFCLAPASQFKVTILEESQTGKQQGAGRQIGELMWQAAFHASRGNLVDSCSRYDVVQFLRWPNLTRLPMTQNTMRICALLTRYPMTIMLVHRKLGIEKKELYQTYSAAYCAGLTSIISRTHQDTSSEAIADTVPDEQVQERSLLRSLFSKITGL